MLTAARLREFRCLRDRDGTVGRKFIRRRNDSPDLISFGKLKHPLQFQLYFEMCLSDCLILILDWDNCLTRHTDLLQLVEKFQCHFTTLSKLKNVNVNVNINV